MCRVTVPEATGYEAVEQCAALGAHVCTFTDLQELCGSGLNPFHGTEEGIVPKIIEQGFNRSFCGRNATFFGKGAYFARDASYSMSLDVTEVRAPHASGVQRMFVCRVYAALPLVSTARGRRTR